MHEQRTYRLCCLLETLGIVRRLQPIGGAAAAMLLHLSLCQTSGLKLHLCCSLLPVHAPVPVQIHNLWKAMNEDLAIQRYQRRSHFKLPVVLWPYCTLCRHWHKLLSIHHLLGGCSPCCCGAVELEAVMCKDQQMCKQKAELSASWQLDNTSFEQHILVHLAPKGRFKGSDAAIGDHSNIWQTIRVAEWDAAGPRHCS